jgi:ADP-ribose pyrophosphatase YjhB (NUDIX family)
MYTIGELLMVINDPVGAGSQWIPEAEYKLIRARVPILCVDFIPLSHDLPPMVGLIRRETYGDGQGWCLVGGAVLRDEPLLTAIERHLHATLGGKVQVESSTLRLLDVIEYFTEPGLGQFHDPRKHSVAPTYFGRCGGVTEPCGEALEFRWFQLGELPTNQFGFGQEEIVKRLISRNAWVEMQG